ncbi:hypothetical protein FQN52_008577 [Onygenales sp. PD_12]|nr:hypothetical protein FQN52_008577 [Onygenales sp. PD_12]
MATRRHKFDGISPSEIDIQFCDPDSHPDASDLSPKNYVVSIRGKKAVMKTWCEDAFKERGGAGAFFRYFRREKAAYERLKAHDVCEQGYVADYYGSVENVDFSDIPDFGEGAVWAIFLEYLPDLHLLSEGEYTEDRWARAEQGIEAIHKARVLYDNVFQPFICTDEGRERVVWMDFENSALFLEDVVLYRWQEDEMLQEARVVKAAGQGMVCA